MSRPLIFALGLLSLLALTSLCIWTHRPNIEGQLAECAQTQLDQSGVEGVDFTISGIVVELRGLVKDRESYEKAYAAVAQCDLAHGTTATLLPGDRIGGVNGTLLKIGALVAPAAAASNAPNYRLADLNVAAQRRGDRLELSGLVSSSSTRDTIVAKAVELFGADNVDDKLETASLTAPAGMAGAFLAALPMVKGLDYGRVDASATRIKLAGETQGDLAQATTFAQTTLAAAGGQGYGVRIRLTSPATIDDMRVVVERKGEGVVLTGAVPDADTHQAVLDAVRMQWADAQIDDQLRVASLGGVPGLLSSASAGLALVKELRNGRADATPSSLTLTGLADDPGAYADRLAALKAALPEGHVINADISKEVSVGVCQAEVNELLAEKIQFLSGSAAILPASDALLAKLASTLRRCPDSNIGIEGHTDSQGADDYNLDLSNQRAKSVKERLIALGMADDRATAKGFGETAPVGDNATVAGRAMNRRIEFKLEGGN